MVTFGECHEDDFDIASGYIRVAEIAARDWIRNGGSPIGTAIPILYNYRHGIELSLKAAIRMAADCLRRDSFTAENLASEVIDEKLHTHNIKKLADLLDQYMGYLEPGSTSGRLDKAERELVLWLDSEDQTGETFRYATVGRGNRSRPARPDTVHFNFYEVVNGLHKLAYMLYAGYSGYLEHLADMQSEYESEMEQFGP